MAERAHPDDPGFQHQVRFRLRRGFFPWLTVRRSKYRTAFFRRYAWVSKYCRGKDVLDVPCGMGWGTSLLRGCRTLVGVDISPDAVAEASSRYAVKAKFVTGSMERLEFPDASFDVVSCLEGIEHVPPEIGERFVAEASRVLRPGGRILMSSPYCVNGAHSGNPYHIKEYRPHEIQALLNTHFEIEEQFERDLDELRIMYLRGRKRGGIHGS